MFLLKGLFAYYIGESRASLFLEKLPCTFTMQLSATSLSRFYDLDKLMEISIHLIKVLKRQYNEIINILQSVSILSLWAHKSTIANILVSWGSSVKSSEYYIIPRIQFPVNVQDHLIGMM